MNLKKYKIIGFDNELKNEPGLLVMLSDILKLKDLRFPFIAIGTDRLGDSGKEIIVLPNDKTSNLIYFESEEI